MRRTHHGLRAWQVALALAEEVYALTSTFPREELFGLTSQMRRSAVSVPGNIAEGAARGSRREFARFLYIARGSLSELDTQCVLARRLGYLGETCNVEERLNEVFALLGGLLNSVSAPE